MVISLAPSSSQWSSLITSGYQWLPEFPSDSQWLLMHGSQQLSQAASGSLWFPCSSSQWLQGSQLFSVVSNDSQWFQVVLNGYSGY